jgi:hypothetical protein
VLIYLLVRYLRNRTPSNYKASSGTARYEPVHSVNHNGFAARSYATPTVNNHRQEPLMGSEPLLYLARNSRAAIERLSGHRSTPKTMSKAAVAVNQRALILHDFDGASVAPNCLAVRKGEVVTVEDCTSPEWWDVRNANQELGFVPARFRVLFLPNFVPHFLQLLSPDGRRATAASGAAGGAATAVFVSAAESQRCSFGPRVCRGAGCVQARAHSA